MAPVERISTVYSTVVSTDLFLASAIVFTSVPLTACHQQWLRSPAAHACFTTATTGCLAGQKRGVFWSPRWVRCILFRSCRGRQNCPKRLWVRQRRCRLCSLVRPVSLLLPSMNNRNVGTVGIPLEHATSHVKLLPMASSPLFLGPYHPRLFIRKVHGIGMHSRAPLARIRPLLPTNNPLPQSSTSSPPRPSTYTPFSPHMSPPHPVLPFRLAQRLPSHPSLLIHNSHNHN